VYNEKYLLDWIFSREGTFLLCGSREDGILFAADKRELSVRDVFFALLR
jgi:hypothetical protein